MKHIVLNDTNGHVSVFDNESFLEQLGEVFPLLFGVELAAVARLRQLINTTNDQGQQTVLDIAALDEMFKQLAEMKAQLENKEEVDGEVPASSLTTSK